MQESNPRRAVLHTAVLPTELIQRKSELRDSNPFRLSGNQQCNRKHLARAARASHPKPSEALPPTNGASLYAVHYKPTQRFELCLPLYENGVPPKTLSRRKPVTRIELVLADYKTAVMPQEPAKQSAAYLCFCD